MVFLERNSISAISLLVLPSLTRVATRISMGVKFRNFEESLLIKGEMMLFRFESRILTRVAWLVFMLLFCRR